MKDQYLHHRPFSGLDFTCLVITICPLLLPRHSRRDVNSKNYLPVLLLSTMRVFEYSHGTRDLLAEW